MSNLKKGMAYAIIATVPEVLADLLITKDLFWEYRFIAEGTEGLSDPFRVKFMVRKGDVCILPLVTTPTCVSVCFIHPDEKPDEALVREGLQWLKDYFDCQYNPYYVRPTPTVETAVISEENFSEHTKQRLKQFDDICEFLNTRGHVPDSESLSEYRKLVCAGYVMFLRGRQLAFKRSVDSDEESLYFFNYGNLSNDEIFGVLAQTYVNVDEVDITRPGELIAAGQPQIDYTPRADLGPAYRIK
jgi:hypothetical protein